MILDASVVIALIDPADAHHEPARRVLLDAAGQHFAAPVVTLAESLVRHVRAGVGPQAQRQVDRLGIDACEVGASPLALAELRLASGLKMPDCIVLAAAETHGDSLATFDHRLAQAASARGVTTVS